MKAARLIAIAASFASTATAIASPEAVARARALILVNRQGPDIACHANCGFTILDAQAQPGSFCANATWVEQLNDCLACAEEASLWENYGDGVSGAADDCNFGVDIEPGASVDSTAGIPDATQAPTGTSASETTLPTPTPTESDDDASPDDAFPDSTSPDSASPDDGSPDSSESSEATSSPEGAAPTVAPYNAILGLAGLAVLAL